LNGAVVGGLVGIVLAFVVLGLEQNITQTMTIDSKG
jgi:hypothetical protein